MGVGMVMIYLAALVFYLMKDDMIDQDQGCATSSGLLALCFEP
jgi:hypothetical protein